MRFLCRRARRREFITIVGGAVVAVVVPITALAQQPTMPVIGFLNSASADGYAVMADAFKQGLKETGYIEGQNVAIEYRWADNAYNRLPGLAADLVKRKVAVIVANSPSIALAMAAQRRFRSRLEGERSCAARHRDQSCETRRKRYRVTIFSGGLAAKRLVLCATLSAGKTRRGAD